MLRAFGYRICEENAMVYGEEQAERKRGYLRKKAADRYRM